MDTLKVTLNEKKKEVVREAIERKAEAKQGKQFAVEQLLQGSLQSMLRELRLLPLTENSSRMLLKLIRASLEGHPTLSLRLVDSHSKGHEIFRINRYPTVNSLKSLVAVVESSAKGVLVDKQLLKFTYKGIKKDIDQGIEKGIFLKIEHSHNKKLFFIFSNRVEQQYNLSKPSREEMGRNFYLEACSKLTPKPRVTSVKEDKRSTEKRVKKAANLNEQLPGFKQRKQQWLKERVSKGSGGA